MSIAGFGWGALSDRFGARIVVLIGAVLLGLGLALASRATSALQFQLAYGAWGSSTPWRDLRRRLRRRHAALRGLAPA